MRVLTKILAMAGAILLGSNAAHAALTYTCDPSISAVVCNYLNTTIAGMYNSTFTNVNADMYITYGATGLAQNEPQINYIPYSTYLSDYAANAAASGNPNQASALASLNTYATPVYAGTNVNISGALGQALGIPASQLTGFTANFDTTGDTCILSAAGCYDDVITVTNNPSTLLFYRTGGPINPNAYDFYSAVEHETDEGLGTESCIASYTRYLPTLFNNCQLAPYDGDESAADLFRYSGPGDLIPDSALSTTPGAYLSYDGGVTNGLGTGRYYNTLVNNADYGDFSANTNCPGYSTGVALAVQDAFGCPGQANIDITNDGGPEITMLSTVGFDLRPAPEPWSLAIILPGVVGLLAVRNRARQGSHAWLTRLTPQSSRADFSRERGAGQSGAPHDW